jgi:hypothetical protein
MKGILERATFFDPQRIVIVRAIICSGILAEFVRDRFLAALSIQISHSQ